MAYYNRFLQSVNRRMDKTGRGVGVGVGDQWIKLGDGSWEITTRHVHVSYVMHSKVCHVFTRDRGDGIKEC